MDEMTYEQGYADGQRDAFERIAGLIDACWRGDKMSEWRYQNTLPDWRMGMSDAAHIVREAQS